MRAGPRMQFRCCRRSPRACWLAERRWRCAPGRSRARAWSRRIPRTGGRSQEDHGDPAVGPWRTGPLAGARRGARSPIAVSDGRSRASAARLGVAGRRSVAAGGRCGSCCRARAASALRGVGRARPARSRADCGPRSSRQGYATVPKFVQVKNLTLVLGTRYNNSRSVFFSPYCSPHRYPARYSCSDHCCSFYYRAVDPLQPS